MTTRILEILRSRGAISDSTMNLTASFVRKWGCTGFEALLETNVFTETKLADLLARSLKIDRLYNISKIVIQVEILSRLPYKYAVATGCLPVNFIGSSGAIEILFADPTDSDAIEKIRKIIGLELNLAVAERSDILNSINQHYPVESQIRGLGGRE